MSKKSGSKSKSSKKAGNVSTPSGVLILRKPCAILFDLVNTSTKTGFIDKVLMEFIKHNVKVYLENEWDDKLIQDDVAKLREASQKDGGPPIIESGSADDIQQSVAKYVIVSTDEKRVNDALFKFRFHMWFYGYKKNKLTTPIYSDVADSITKWYADNIKLYVCSNSWKEVSQRLLAQTNHGNLTTFITDYFDSSEGAMNQRDTFLKIVERIKQKSEDILFLTNYGEEARAAHDAGLECVLVLTHQTDLDRRLEEDKKLPLVRTFNDIQFSDNAPRLSQLQKASGGGSGKAVSVKSASRKSGSASKAKAKSKSMSSKKKSAGASIGGGPSKNQEKSASIKPTKGSNSAASASPATQKSTKSWKSATCAGGSVGTGSKGSTKAKSASKVSSTISSNVKAASGSGASSVSGSRTSSFKSGSVKSSMVSSSKVSGSSLKSLSGSTKSGSKSASAASSASSGAGSSGGNSGSGSFSGSSGGGSSGGGSSGGGSSGGGSSGGGSSGGGSSGGGSSGGGSSSGGSSGGGSSGGGSSVASSGAGSGSAVSSSKN